MCRVTLSLSSGLDFVPVGFEEFVRKPATTTAAEKPSSKAQEPKPAISKKVTPKLEKKQKTAKQAKAAEEDKVLAERFRTKKCRTFLEKGKCPYVSRCMFAHGDHELRTTKENLRDGLTSEEAIKEFKKNQHLKSRARQAEIRHKRQKQKERDAAAAAAEEFYLSDVHSEGSNNDNTIIICHSGEGEQSYVHNPYGFNALAVVAKAPRAHQ